MCQSIYNKLLSIHNKSLLVYNMIKCVYDITLSLSRHCVSIMSSVYLKSQCVYVIMCVYNVSLCVYIKSLCHNFYNNRGRMQEISANFKHVWFDKNGIASNRNKF